MPTSTAAASTVSVATAASPSASMALASSAADALHLYAAMMPVVGIMSVRHKQSYTALLHIR